MGASFNPSSETWRRHPRKFNLTSTPLASFCTAHLVGFHGPDESVTIPGFSEEKPESLQFVNAQRRSCRAMFQDINAQSPHGHPTRKRPLFHSARLVQLFPAPAILAPLGRRLTFLLGIVHCFYPPHACSKFAPCQIPACQSGANGPSPRPFVIQTH